MKACRAAPGVHWLVGRTSLTVVDRLGASGRVAYPEAAVWDFLVRGHSPAEASHLVAAVASLDPAGAAEVVRASIERWIACGWLEEA